MNTTQDIANEIANASSYDIVRRNKYAKLVEITKRPLIVYGTAFLQPMKANGFNPYLAIDLSDRDGFYEMINGIESKEVDIWIHSPGGSAEATESIVKMLRHKFDNIRFIISGVAKSAATMLALSGNEILLTTASEMGPIDPQVRVRDRYSPAGSVIEQFEIAVKQLKDDPAALPAWIPILQEFAPSLMIECQNFINLAEKLVTEWMCEYMFKGDKNAKRKANKIAKYLTNEKETLSHARRVDFIKLKELGAKVKLIDEENEVLKDAINDVHLSIMATLNYSEAIKFFENSQGAALFINVQADSINK